MVEKTPDGEGCPAGQKPNPRIGTLEHYRAATTAPDNALSGCLKNAVTAMTGGAWDSPMGAQFYRELIGHQRALANVGEHARGDIDAEISRTPRCVNDPLASAPGGLNVPIFQPGYPTDGTPPLGAGR